MPNSKDNSIDNSQTQLIGNSHSNKNFAKKFDPNTDISRHSDSPVFLNDQIVGAANLENLHNNPQNSPTSPDFAQPLNKKNDQSKSGGCCVVS